VSVLSRIHKRMSKWSFFDKRVCLTTHPEEWKLGQQEFDRVGLSVEKFQSLPIDDDKILGPHQSFSGSVRQILTEFNESNAQTLLHVEDDCLFRDLWHLEYALHQLPEDWDVVYLGANLILWEQEKPQPPTRYSSRLFRVYGAWTTHAVGFNKKVVPFLLENQPGLSERMFDNWMSSQLPNLNAYVVAPMVAYQRERFSSIWNRHDDYTPIFEESDRLLR